MGVAALAWSHTQFSGSDPAAGAAVDRAPEHLGLNYADKVTLIKVVITDQHNQIVETGFKADPTAASTFSIPLPPLEAGQYRVDWTALGADGHSLEDTFSFTLNSTAR